MGRARRVLWWAVRRFIHGRRVLRFIRGCGCSVSLLCKIEVYVWGFFGFEKG